MKLIKRIAAMFFLLFLLLYPRMTPSAITELKDNQLDMKTNRIETKTGEKEIQGGNQEILFDETIMKEWSERKAKETQEREEKAEKIFIEEMKEAKLYDPSELFTDSEAVKPAEQTTTKAAETPVNHNDAVLFTGGGFAVVVGGAIASVLNYKKGA